jgi:hypothetical protein
LSSSGPRARRVITRNPVLATVSIERPGAETAKDIFSKYVLKELPLHPDDLAEHQDSPQATVEAMILRTVEQMYTESEENRFLEVTYANGDKEVLYFKDFNSGAMIENIVAPAKKMAIKKYCSPSSATCGKRSLTHRPRRASVARRLQAARSSAASRGEGVG